MKLLLSGLLLLSVSAACRPTPPAAQSPAKAAAQPADGRAALAVLLAWQQAREAGRGRGRHLCIVPELAPSLGSARGAFLTATAGRPIPSHWYTSPAAGNAIPVDPALAERLDRLLAAAQREPVVTGPPITADMVHAPANLGCRDDRDDRDNRDNRDSLSFSTPLLVEDIAFIESGYVCGGLCGSGALIALQRQAGNWIPVARMATWIS